MSTGLKTTPRSTREADVTAMLKLMATTLKNVKTYRQNNPVLKKSFSMLYESLRLFLAQNESLTLLVRENDLIFGHSVVYASVDKMDSFAFALYKDGIRLITFRDGLSRRELRDFLAAIHEAKEVDPYEADVVTILWEKDLANITYRAVDAYLESDEKKSIEELARKPGRQYLGPGRASVVPSSDFFTKEIGLSPEETAPASAKDKLQMDEAEARNIVRDILEEDDESILRRCSDVCLEIIKSAPRDDTFNRVVEFLGRICDWLVSSGDFLSACSILSDLRALAGQNDLASPRKASIMDTISKRSESRKIQQIEEHLHNLSDAQSEEIFAYLALMSPVAVEPLCDMLAASEVRKVRYLLCRAISILGRSELDRLRPYIHDERWFFVRNVVMILGMMATPQAIPILKLAASHPEPRVRREVARSLGKLRSPDGHDVLKVLLEDGNKMVRLASLAALGDIGGSRAKRLLENLISDRSFGRKSLDEKTETFRTYGGLGDETFEFLEAVVTGRKGNFDDRTQASAVFGLARIGTAKVTEMLKRLTNEGAGAVRYAASEALGLRDATMPVGAPDGN
jgi:HEAT repeat protein